MKLIGHQRVRVNGNLVPAAQAAQLAEHDLVVCLRETRRLPRHAALNEQVRVPGNGQAGKACHGLLLPCVKPLNCALRWTLPTFCDQSIAKSRRCSLIANRSVMPAM